MTDPIGTRLINWFLIEGKGGLKWIFKLSVGGMAQTTYRAWKGNANKMILTRCINILGLLETSSPIWQKNMSQTNDSTNSSLILETVTWQAIARYGSKTFITWLNWMCGAHQPHLFCCAFPHWRLQFEERTPWCIEGLRKKCLKKTTWKISRFLRTYCRESPYVKATFFLEMFLPKQIFLSILLPFCTHQGVYKIPFLACS